MKGRWISLELSEALFDTNLGYTAFTVQRTTYNRQNGTSVPSTKTMSAAGAIHPGTPEMLQLLPAEERHEEFIAIYTDFPLSLGENPGGETCTTPDRITWNGKTWRVVKVKSWSAFSYCQCLAVKVDQTIRGRFFYGRTGGCSRQCAPPLKTDPGDPQIAEF